MPHVNNGQDTRAAKTAETGECDSLGSGGGGRLGGAGRTGALAFTTVGGRRFLLTLVSGAGTFLLCWQGKISDDVYSVVTIATVAAYITNNTVQKIKAPEAPNA
jgi:hypothetical protein